MTRVAVLGVPRGGTSLVVGLLRILGYQLPAADPCCLLGESRVLRWADSPLGGDLDQLATQVQAIPDGTVWKDPAVALYADRIDWRTWHTVRVVRDPSEVARSEARWLTEPVDETAMRNRAVQWAGRLDLVLPLLTLHAAAIRMAPQTALTRLSWALHGTPPTETQRRQAEAFVSPAGGYRCPLPQTCTLDGAHHQLP